MTQIDGKPFTQLTNLNILDELRFNGQIFGPREFDSSVPTGSVTATSGDWIEANNGVTVTLSEDSVVDDEIVVTNGDGSSINICSGSVDIKYTSVTNKIIIRQQGTTLHFQMFGNGSDLYWRIR